MDEQRDGIALAVALLDGREHAARRGHPQAPAAAERKRLAETTLDERRKLEQHRRRPSSACAAPTGSRGFPMIRSGVRLESKRNPLLDSTSSAHIERSLIDHCGARKPADRCDARRLQRGDAAIDLVGKRVRRQLVHRVVKLTVRGDLVPGGRQSARPGRDIAPRPTRARRTCRGPGGDRAGPAAAAYSRRRGSAGCPSAARLEGPADAADVKPLLDVNGQAVAHHVSCQSTRALPRRLDEVRRSCARCEGPAVPSARR